MIVIVGTGTGKSLVYQSLPAAADRMALYVMVADESIGKEPAWEEAIKWCFEDGYAIGKEDSRYRWMVGSDIHTPGLEAIGPHVAGKRYKITHMEEPSSFIAKKCGLSKSKAIICPFLL